MARMILIHAVTVAMAPVEAAFRRLWPEAERVNLLDDALSVDRERAGALTPAIARRIDGLADYGMAIGGEAILYTCSAFGPAIEAVAGRLSVPVLKPNEAMFDAALAAGRRIGMLATFPPSVESMEAEFAEMARAQGSAATIETICVPEAMKALKAGDAARHDAALAEAAPRLAHCDALLLAHFSTARAEPAVAAAVPVPVLTAPMAAVARLRQAIAA
jgi:hypothetical protein